MTGRPEGDELPHAIHFARHGADLPAGAQPMAAVQRLRTIVALLDRSAERVARRSGFNAGDMAVLYILNRTPEAAPIRAADLQRSLMNTSGAITKRLDRLQAGGMIRRGPDPTDGRAALVTITAAGRTLIDATRSGGGGGGDPPRFGLTLSTTEWAQLNGLLDRLLDYAHMLDAHDPPPLKVVTAQP